MSNRAGRPPKAYRTTWGEVISGLDRQSDGRWRIIESGYRFTEANESRAIQKFRQLTSATKPVVTLTIPVTKPDMAPEDILDGWNKPLPESHFLAINPSSIAVTLDADERTVDRTADFNIDEKSVLNWVRKQLIENPAEFARKIGIEQIAYLTDLKKPTDITIEDLISNYEKRQRDKSSTVATLRTFRKFVDDTKIKSIQEMTTERLLTFRDKIEKSNFGTGYKKFIYSRIKMVVAANGKFGMDAELIQAALARLKVLFTDSPMPANMPQPISREYFQALLSAANPQWKAILLIGLNGCLHLGEVLSLLKSDIDFNRKILIGYRTKTRIPRCACLWEETLAALAVRRDTPHAKYLFLASHGSRHNRNSAANSFADLRKRAGVPDTVKFDHLRDGAFTIAYQVVDGEKIAKLYAGHACGMEDHYVFRKPEMVRPVCDAVYRHYLG